MDKRKIVILVLVLIFALTLTGCWGKSEFNEILFASSMGIDAIEDGYMITTMVRLPKDPKGEGSSIWLISGQGKTIYDAIHDLYKQSPRKIFWGHLNTVILGESAINDNFAEALDLFTRAQELRRKTKVMTTEGTAQEFLQEGAKLAGAVDPFYLANLIRNYEKSTAHHWTDINDVLVSIGEDGHDLFIPSVKVVDKLKLEDFSKSKELAPSSENGEQKEPQGDPMSEGEEQNKAQDKGQGKEKPKESGGEEKPEETKVIAITGGALFREDKFVTFINVVESEYLYWLIGDIQSGVVIVDYPRRPGKKLTCDIEDSKSKLKLVDKEKLKYKVEVEVSLSIIESVVRSPEEVLQEGMRLQEESMILIEKEIERQIKEIIDIMQKNNCDIIAIGEHLNSFHPKLYAQQDWHDVFPNIEIEVEVKPTMKLKSLTH